MVGAPKYPVHHHSLSFENTMKTAYRAMKNRVSRALPYPVTIAALSAISISIILIFTFLTMTLSNVKEELEVNLHKYVRFFASDSRPFACELMTFPFFYNVDAEALNVEDHHIEDWSILTESSKRSKLQTSSQDPSILYEPRPCGLARTPLDASHSTGRWRADDAKQQFTGYDFAIQFARDTIAQSLYIMGHIETSSQDMLPEQFSLRLDYADRTQQSFTLVPQDRQLVLKASFLYHFDPSSPKLSPEQEPSHGVTFTGTSWVTVTPLQADKYFEIRLDNAGMITAFDIAAEKLDDKEGVRFRAGTRAPIPLDEETHLYQLTRKMLEPVAYELYLLPKDLPPVLMSNSRVRRDQKGEVSPVSRQPGRLPRSYYLSELLSPAYKLYFLFAGIGPCSTAVTSAPPGTETCFRITGPEHNFVSYRLRMGKKFWRDRLYQNEGEVEALVFVEKALNFTHWHLVLSMSSVPFVVPLVGFLAHTNRRKNDAILAQTRTSEQLADANAKLEEKNRTLADAARVFAHEGRRCLDRTNALIKEVIVAADLQGSREERNIDHGFRDVRTRLLQSPDVLRLPEIVQDGIQRCGHERFSPRESINGVLEDYEGSEFHFPEPLPGNEEPTLPATALDDPQKSDSSPDHYFVQAMEKIISNAVHYHTPRTTISISLEADRKHVFIHVSNHGPTVPREKLDAVFEYGTRFTGATQKPSEVEESEDAGHAHLGIGLFITKQIVEGYNGSCRMANEPDGTGVIVTIRVPFA